MFDDSDSGELSVLGPAVIVTSDKNAVRGGFDFSPHS